MLCYHSLSDRAFKRTGSKLDCRLKVRRPVIAKARLGWKEGVTVPSFANIVVKLEIETGSAVISSYKQVVVELACMLAIVLAGVLSGERLAWVLLS